MIYNLPKNGRQKNVKAALHSMNVAETETY